MPLTVVVSALPLSTNTKTKKVCCLLMLLLGSFSVSYAKDYADAMAFKVTAPSKLCFDFEGKPFTIPAISGSFDGGFIVDTDAKTVTIPGNGTGTYTSTSERMNNSKHYYGFISITRTIPRGEGLAPQVVTFKGSFVSTRIGSELIASEVGQLGTCGSRIVTTTGKLINPIVTTVTKEDLRKTGVIYDYAIKLKSYLPFLDYDKSKKVKLIKKETVSGVRG